MDNNPLSIDLKKLRKNIPPPPISVAPLNADAPQPPRPEPTAPPTPPPASTSMLPPKPRPQWMPKWKMPVPSLRHAVFAAIAIAVLVGGYYIYERFWTQSPFGPTGGAPSDQSASAATTSTSEPTEADIVSEVGKLMLLPTDETPTLAKVSDPAVLQNQIFFKNAVVGDVVLMYAKSLRAILYDPAQNKIIEVGPITATTSTATSTN